MPSAKGRTLRTNTSERASSLLKTFFGSKHVRLYRGVSHVARACDAMVVCRAATIQVPVLIVNMQLSISNSKFVYRITTKLCGVVDIIEIAPNPKGISPKNSESRVPHPPTCVVSPVC